MEQSSSVSDPPGRRAHRTVGRTIAVALALVAVLASCRGADHHDTLATIKQRGTLLYGADKEGGGPFAYPDPEAPERVTGFEVELMDALAADLGVKAEFAQGQWDTLLQNLATDRIDVVVNGYEWTEARARDYLASRPYYVYQLQVMARRDGPIRSWADLTKPRPDGSRWKLGVLGGSSAEDFARAEAPETVEVIPYTGATDAMLSVVNGQLDATLQDLPAVRFYRGQFPALAAVGEPVGRGHYVIYARQGDQALIEALNRAIDRLIADGRLKRIYQDYDIWTDAQDELATWKPSTRPSLGRQESARGWPLIRKYSRLLGRAALMTIFLSVTAMPLAILIGLAVALVRLYGPTALRLAAAAYVEFLRGTPLMLQLFVLFYLLRLPPLAAGILGLAINYSAYEAEIYRAGLQAIPTGQMEAALALGMGRRLALRRVIVPQAVRIVIPPVTNDFIALFKDTSVCSVITLIELSKQYQILANSTGGVLEFAVATSLLYLAMSLPLSWFSRWSERQLSGDGRKGGVMA